MTHFRINDNKTSAGAISLVFLSLFSPFISPLSFDCANFSFFNLLFSGSLFYAARFAFISIYSGASTLKRESSSRETNQTADTDHARASTIFPDLRDLIFTKYIYKSAVSSPHFELPLWVTSRERIRSYWYFSYSQIRTYHAFSLFLTSFHRAAEIVREDLSRAPRDFLYFHTTRRSTSWLVLPFSLGLRYRIHYIMRYIDTVPAGVHSHGGAALIVRG